MTALAIDAMGAERGVEEMIRAVAHAYKAGYIQSRCMLFGREPQIQTALQSVGLVSDPRIEIRHTEQVVTMEDKPTQVFKQKKDSSMLQAIQAVKDGVCDAAVSCGNTGALMASATLMLRPMEGVKKPALATVWPSKDHFFVMLDAGANPECRPEHLLHYAVLGEAYARCALELPKPRVGLLSIGTEEGKGNDLVNETHPLLKQCGELFHYEGLVEGFSLFQQGADVIVTDGFTGNVVLKTCEGLWKMLKGLLKEEVQRNPLRMGGYLMMKGAFQDARARLDPDQYGGAPLLGLKGTVLKAHGSSEASAIAHALRIAENVVKHDLNRHCREAIARVNEIVKPAQG